MVGKSVFFPPELTASIRSNVAGYEWAARAREQAVKAAEPWREMTDEALWSLMFGCRIPRSWMVWSNGFCPACSQQVPMYNWRIDAFAHPWKVQCPHCEALFPKNDFAAFRRSGLDEAGVFDPARADRSLLFNTEHPRPDDPLHTFGVDDGTGYRDGEHCWRFIGTYLVYGQWRQLVVGGIRALADAFVLTGEQPYAHKAAVLLDRVADLYPTFDFGEQAILYERKGDRGYVSTWHDACEETRQMVLAYDAIQPGLQEDQALVTFLHRKAREVQVHSPKRVLTHVHANIQRRILRDVLRHPHKIRTNFPRHEICKIVIHMVLGWPENREQVMGKLDRMLKKTTAVDGLTGEKGLCAYTSYTIRSVATFLERVARTEPNFLPELLERHPRMRRTWRFHIDTKCLGRYYPRSGDCGWFCSTHPAYASMDCRREPGLRPSCFSFLWRMYEATGDAAYVQTLYGENEERADGVPYDLSCGDPQAFQRRVAAVIDELGPTPALGSVNKQEWCLAVLRSGTGDHARALWLDYDAGERHSHSDLMNLGLFAHGLDLMPDFGYPPVNYGGWGSPHANWYRMSAAHNTVVVDKQMTLPRLTGKTTLWAQGESFRAITASAPDAAGCRQFERTAVLVDVSETDFYILDLFRVVGGSEHVRWMHSHFADMSTHGLQLQPAEPWVDIEQMRHYRADPSPAPGWWADWRIEDVYGLRPEADELHVRLTDMTTGASAMTCEGWVATGGSFNTTESAWIPRVATVRRGGSPLQSTFAGIIEVYRDRAAVRTVRRLAPETVRGERYPDANVALEIELTDGRRDLFIAADVENCLKQTPSLGRNQVMTLPERDLRFRGRMCWIRTGKDGRPVRVALCQARALDMQGLEVKLTEKTSFVEFAGKDGRWQPTAGQTDTIETLSATRQ